MSDHARAEVALCVTDALHDPYAASPPYGVDDGIMRVTGSGCALPEILINADEKTFTVIRLGYAG